MTPAEIKAARKSLNLTVEGLAAILNVEGRTVRRWEDGTRAIPGTPAVLITALLRSPAVRRYFMP
jgi:DNA-binding transcriptional regulator YiaG